MENHLLIIDDDRIFIHMHEQLLVKNGLTKEPRKFLSCVEAMDYIIANNSNSSSFFVFLDIYMDDMDGWDFMDGLYSLQLQDKVAVVVVTSSINLHDSKKSAQYGNIISYVEKPFTDEHVRKLIAETELAAFL